MSRRSTLVAPILLVVSMAAAAIPSEGLAEGKYTRRQRARGDVTDTSPKLDRFAFVNDTAAPPQRLVLFVDAWPARMPRNPLLLPLRIALSYEGHGEAIPIRPGLFELSWEGAAAPVKALTHEELVRAAAGNWPLHHDLRTLSARAGLTFDTPRAEPVFVQFYSDPSLPMLRFDDMNLASQLWFETLAYFPMPEGFDRWAGLFDLRYVPEEGGAPAVTCTFRIERDPALNARAMRRARKDLRAEDKHRE